VDEARRAIEAADVRIRSASEAVAAATSAQTLRRARHEQGLLPLTDVLDAQTALAGARALLTQGRLEARTARARLALALGQPIEGTNP
jgi:outer membrane protein TolC